MKKLLALLVLVAILGVATWMVLSVNTEPQVADTAKLRNKAAAAAQTQQDPGLRPKPGLYEYTGAGHERVQVLGGTTNTFPRKITGIVTLQDGCNWTLELTYLDDRTVTHHYCTTRTTITESSWTEVVTFFGRSEDRTFTCSDAVRARQTPATWKATCDGSDDSTSATRIEQQQGASYSFGTTTVHSVRAVTETTAVSGTTRGTARMLVWYLPTGLPARIKRSDDVRSKTFFGETPYTQESDYRLVSVTPST